MAPTPSPSLKIPEYVHMEIFFYFTGVPANDCENNPSSVKYSGGRRKMNGGGLKVDAVKKDLSGWMNNSEFVHVRQVLNSAVILIASIPCWGQKGEECPVWWSGLNLCNLQVCCFRPGPSQGWFASKTKWLKWGSTPSGLMLPQEIHLNEAHTPHIFTGVSGEFQVQSDAHWIKTKTHTHVAGVLVASQLGHCFLG